MRRKMVGTPVAPAPVMAQPIERTGLTPEEAAESMGLGLTNTYAVIREKKLGVVRRGRKIIVPVDEIRAFLRREMEGGSARVTEKC